MSQQRGQARYLKARIEQLNSRLARFMRLTEMPFSLKLDPDERVFTFTTQDGYVHPAVHLSGAQKSMSAVALQMALLAVMRPGMNLYLVDEPAEALDGANKLVLAGMFHRLNKMFANMDGTMLVVTRDEQIVESCENNIEITGGEAK